MDRWQSPDVQYGADIRPELHPNPTVKAYNISPDSLTGFGGLKHIGEWGMKTEKAQKGKGKDEKGEGRVIFHSRNF